MRQLFDLQHTLLTPSPQNLCCCSEHPGGSSVEKPVRKCSLCQWLINPQPARLPCSAAGVWGGEQRTDRSSPALQSPRSLGLRKAISALGLSSPHFEYPHHLLTLPKMTGERLHLHPAALPLPCCPCPKLGHLLC